jgi:serine/threonine protein kinase
MLTRTQSQSNTSFAPPRFLVLKTCEVQHGNLHGNDVRAYTILRDHKDISNNIARFYGSWRQGDTYNILLEYIEGGTLEELFTKDHGTTAWDMLSFWNKLFQVMDPVCRIHCYRDPESYNEVAHREVGATQYEIVVVSRIIEYIKTSNHKIFLWHQAF